MKNTLTNTSDNNLNIIGLDQMDKMLTLAKIMSTSTVSIPKHLKNEGDCLAIIMQSAQWGMNPFSVAQKTFLLNGVLGYESQLVSAIINNNAPIKQRLEYEFFGPWENVIGKTKEKVSQKGHKYPVSDSTPQDELGVGVIVRATLQGETKPRELNLLLLQVTTRNSTLWAEDPKQQLAYLAAKKWSRLFCPDVILGVYTHDEAEQIAETQTYLTDTIEEAVKQLGLELNKQDKYAYVIGNTFQYSNFLKTSGFTYENEQWTILIDSNSNSNVNTTEPINDIEAEIVDERIQPATTQKPQSKKPHPSPARLFNYLKYEGLTTDEHLIAFVNEILGVTKEDVEEIDEILLDLPKLNEMINEFKETEGISINIDESTEINLFNNKDD
ncbi:MAG: hypothetical protein CL624_09375 [Arcobacter sp.]|nr:hypothetical protein [Arcobacter sp.]|tara:strand:- start:46258 stop:47409 length:1152 start_codon:yes stop_codon:yes gene_type:complete